MKQAHGDIVVATRGKGLYEISSAVRRWVAEQGIGSGLLTVFLQHTTASLIIQENADPDVRRDMSDFFGRIVPDDTPWFRHTLEGPDDMTSHIRSALTSVSLSIPVRDAAPALGTWQGIYVFEHRTAPHRRRVLLHLIGGPEPGAPQKRRKETDE